MSGSRTKVDDALSNLASRLKLESLKLNEKNETYLLFDQKFHVTCVFDETKDEFVLTSFVGELERNSPDAYKKLLGDNFFWAGTAGSRLFLDPGAEDSPDTIIIKEIVPIAMFDEERLYERMEDFVNAVEYWTTEYPKLKQGGGKIQSTGGSSPVAGSSSSPISDFGMISA
ncbi:MAG: type III secretion system chaperone [Puniceicoccales bacterium]|jgi:hypothetical protein|nr:type III secretion system chaperone [Puniceicoccales bacterium]